MTQEDWIRLTNRPDVVEKDMIKLLDWFIKVSSIRFITGALISMLFRPIHQEEYHNYFSKSFSQLLQQEKHQQQLYSECQMKIMVEPQVFLRFKRFYCLITALISNHLLSRPLIYAMLKHFMNKSSGHLEYLTVTTPNPLLWMSLESQSSKFGRFLRGLVKLNIILVTVKR